MAGSKDPRESHCPPPLSGTSPTPAARRQGRRCNGRHRTEKVKETTPMGLFSKRQAAPRISGEELNRYGRHKIRGTDSSDWSFAGDLEMRAYQWGQGDRAGFMTGMVQVAEGGG